MQFPPVGRSFEAFSFCPEGGFIYSFCTFVVFSPAFPSKTVLPYWRFSGLGTCLSSVGHLLPTVLLLNSFPSNKNINKIPFKPFF